MAEKKFKANQTSLYLKSLIYFDDVIIEPIKFKTKKISIEQVKSFLIDEVKKI